MLFDPAAQYPDRPTAATIYANLPNKPACIKPLGRVCLLRSCKSVRFFSQRKGVVVALNSHPH